MDGKSFDAVQDNIDKLKQLFPNIFSEGKIDIVRLRQELGEEALTQNEHYELSWAGKSEARLEIQKRTTSTLIPDKEGSIEFDNAQNIFIEGENLEVLRVLQQSYFGRVKMIYIDPPYNTGNDSFVYPDDYSERRDEYLKRTNAIDEEGYLNKQDLWCKNTKENGQYHSAWLSMMYPRLYIARNLLREDGVIFISIDDNEAANLKLLCDEVFGEENFITIIAHKSRASVSNDKIISQNHNHILLYAKNQQIIFNERTQFGLKPDLESFNLEDEQGRYKLVPVSAPGGSKKGNPYFEFLGVEGYFRFSKQTMEDMYNEGLIVKNGETLQQKYYLEKAKKTRKTDTSWWDYKFYTSTATTRLNKLLGGDFFTNPKPIELICRMLELINDKDGIILDFFAGSGTTAQAVMELNEEDGGSRRFICVQMPELLDEKSEGYKAGYRTIADICKERIRRSIAKIEKEREGKLEFEAKQLLAFAAYKIAPSNFKVWQSDAEKMDLAQQLIDFTQSERANSQPQNMLIELLLKNEKEALTIDYRFEDGFYKTAKMWFCFDTYTQEQKEKLIANKPKEVIYLNSSFDTDEDLTNLKLELQDNDIKLTLV